MGEAAGGRGRHRSGGWGGGEDGKSICKSCGRSGISCKSKSLLLNVSKSYMDELWEQDDDDEEFRCSRKSMISFLGGTSTGTGDDGRARIGASTVL